MNSILLTDSAINKTSGGGIVSFNLLEVLQELSDVKLILSGQHFPDGKYDGKIPSYCIRPDQFNYYCPYFQDYFAKALIESGNIPSIELAISYGCPWGDTFEYLKKNTFSKCVADLAPHDVLLSRQEHLKFAGKYDYPHLNDEFLFKMYLKHLRLADLVIVHSKISADYIEKAAGLKKTPVSIPHGTYIPNDIPQYPDEFIPANMGSLGADKGLVYLINAIINCKPEINLMLGGFESQGFNIEDKYKNRFKVVGAITNLYDFYKQVSVFVAPSVTEGFGLCGLEAMAHGRPVIVSTGTGVADLIQDGREGFVIPIRDPNIIREKLEWFKDNPGEIKRMGAEARKTAEKYSWELIKKRYIDEIQKIL